MGSDDAGSSSTASRVAVSASICEGCLERGEAVEAVEAERPDPDDLTAVRSLAGAAMADSEDSADSDDSDDFMEESVVLVVVSADSGAVSAVTASASFQVPEARGLWEEPAVVSGEVSGVVFSVEGAEPPFSADSAEGLPTVCAGSALVRGAAGAADGAVGAVRAVWADCADRV